MHFTVKLEATVSNDGMHKSNVLGFSQHINFWKLLCINVTNLWMTMTSVGFHIKGKVHAEVKFTLKQATKA